MKTIYDNCAIYAPDGQFLARCSEDRIQWYLDRNLATVVSENPTCVRLLFEPSGRDGATEIYNVSTRKNECVVCAFVGELQRHHVIPYSFSRYLPRICVNYNSHDILAMCEPCHHKYERASDAKRLELAKRYNIDPTNLMVEQKRIHKLASLCQSFDFVPEEHREKVFGLIQATAKSPMSLEEIRSYASLKAKNKKTLKFKVLSEVIVEQVTDLQAFFEEWRHHFVTVMNPQHLPEGWSITKKVRQQ